MIEGPRFALFISAAALLALTPGPGILYVLEELFTADEARVFCPRPVPFSGGSFHVLAAAFGLSSILMTSAAAFEGVRYAGPFYLIYIGISMIRHRHATSMTQREASNSERNLVQGIVTEVLNPNTAVGLIVVLFAAPIARRFADSPNFIQEQRTASGVGMIGFGVYVAASK